MSTKRNQPKWTKSRKRLGGFPCVKQTFRYSKGIKAKSDVLYSMFSSLGEIHSYFDGWFIVNIYPGKRDECLLSHIPKAKWPPKPRSSDEITFEISIDDLSLWVKRLEIPLSSIEQAKFANEKHGLLSPKRRPPRSSPFQPERKKKGV